jgi:ATP:cob(I)alamin adenosyltransferase
MVRLTRIYTRTGDAGQTQLSDLSPVSKTDSRVEAYGDVDEANSAIGVAIAASGLPDDVAIVLRIVQNEMFDVGADLSTPLRVPTSTDPRLELRITQDYIDRLEDWCDRFGEPLPNLKSFILPGGSPAAAQLHVARTVVGAPSAPPGQPPPHTELKRSQTPSFRAGSTRWRSPISTGSRTCCSSSPASLTEPTAMCCGYPGVSEAISR